MGREVRRVPRKWKHPTDANGRFIPLYNGHNDAFAKLDAEWVEEEAKWREGFKKDWKTDGWVPIDAEDVGTPFSDWHGSRPVKSDYMPSWPDKVATHYMMYETVSEGTPISPAFATPEELARWLADTGANAGARLTASYESWLRVAQGGYAPSFVIDCRGILQGD